ncbi:hypothetical protein [Leptodesmis sp.]|uniref:hypothetical protein n=1 Tax=Leptodesmis sp. TaxID=3100501 RepID=UPI00405358D4
MGPIIASIIDKLNEVVKRATQSTKAQYLDCRRVTEPYTWYDDMHPTEMASWPWQLSLKKR